MAAINGANRGLGLVTHGLETDFPEDERNTDPGVAAVQLGVTYKIRNVDKTGTAVLSPVVSAIAVLTGPTVQLGTVIGPSA